ncbi:major tail protein [Arthrobacter phage Elesar]|uniref:Major tail protein n=1 Tax=Arthrobacter phage Elesar TaxID=2510522 RepID=A0A411CQI9_9CAUD|nr:major tail protein [Arthrobacter phage Elesar]QAY16067.1 major tail protein [Arthrobacter phage Elesar]
MPTFATIQADADERSLVRKVQKAVAFVAPMSVELPEALTGADSLPIDIKTAGFLPVGLVSPDGYNFGREVEKEDIDALGYASPIRSDVTRVPRSVSFTVLEKGRKHMLELIYGTSLTGVTQRLNGELIIDEPDLPVDAEWRLLVVGSDGPAANNWLLGRGYGAVKLSATGEEVWGREGAVSQQLTFDVFTDDEVGVPVRHYFGGTGAKASTVLGFTKETA